MENGARRSRHHSDRKKLISSSLGEENPAPRTTRQYRGEPILLQSNNSPYRRQSCTALTTMDAARSRSGWSASHGAARDRLPDSPKRAHPNPPRVRARPSPKSRPQMVQESDGHTPSTPPPLSPPSASLRPSAFRRGPARHLAPRRSPEASCPPRPPPPAGQLGDRTLPQPTPGPPQRQFRYAFQRGYPNRQWPRRGRRSPPDQERHHSRATRRQDASRRGWRSGSMEPMILA